MAQIHIPAGAVRAFYNAIVDAARAPKFNPELEDDEQLIAFQAALVMHVELLRRLAGPELFAQYEEAARRFADLVDGSGGARQGQA